MRCLLAGFSLAGKRMEMATWVSYDIDKHASGRSLTHNCSVQQRIVSLACPFDRAGAILVNSILEFNVRSPQKMPNNF